MSGGGKSPRPSYRHSLAIDGLVIATVDPTNTPRTGQSGSAAIPPTAGARPEPIYSSGRRASPAVEGQRAWHHRHMSGQAGSQPHFDHPPSLDAPTPPGLADVLVEATRMHEMRLAELQAFVNDLEAEQGPVTEEELQAVRDEWLG